MTDGLTLPRSCPYALTGVAAHPTHDGGLALDATLTHDGVPFATVSNDGRGGADLLRPLAPGDQRRIDTYRAYADEVLGPQGVVYEPEDELTSLLLEAWAAGQQEPVDGDGR
ncbi:hypothetical protein KIN34_14350 [Cellulomonas sp. DKR-3]|uniref:Uncharacterized protein n=1 Tax=Cellulomonas fulva TaxID=2835530 RepID=A0ABS5U251_9CELL|nr:hypothetical protein [Cellulomonas fulva]MBT0995464.1 hypothetical protein [Cellulomonas fulva]